MLLNLLWNFGHLMYQWVETARYKYEQVYSCNICLGKGREYDNALYGLYETVLLWEEGPEGVKWELGLAGFCPGKMGFKPLGLGFGHWEWE